MKQRQVLYCCGYNNSNQDTNNAVEIEEFDFTLDVPIEEKKESFLYKVGDFLGDNAGLIAGVLATVAGTVLAYTFANKYYNYSSFEKGFQDPDEDIKRIFNWLYGPSGFKDGKASDLNIIDSDMINLMSNFTRLEHSGSLDNPPIIRFIKPTTRREMISILEKNKAPHKSFPRINIDIQHKPGKSHINKYVIKNTNIINALTPKKNFDKIWKATSEIMKKKIISNSNNNHHFMHIMINPNDLIYWLVECVLPYAYNTIGIRVIDVPKWSNDIDNISTSAALFIIGAEAVDFYTGPELNKNNKKVGTADQFNKMNYITSIGNKLPYCDVHGAKSFYNCLDSFEEGTLITGKSWSFSLVVQYNLLNIKNSY